MKEPSEKQLKEYEIFLTENERAEATIRKYTRDVSLFFSYMKEKPIDKSAVMAYKRVLAGKYAPASLNTVICALNGFFEFCGRHDLCLKNVRIQRRIFEETDRELTKSDYEKLLQAAARRNERLFLLMQTIASTGMRVSELKFITVDAIDREYADVNNKGKRRRIWLPRDLCRMLREYCRKQRRWRGSVFVTRYGNPLDRSNIWDELKRLCDFAHVYRKKVFPHNLRHLFARTYYSARHDIVRLADLLGHSSVETTRIYTMESGVVHRRQIQDLGLLQSPNPMEKNTTP